MLKTTLAKAFYHLKTYWMIWIALVLLTLSVLYFTSIWVYEPSGLIAIRWFYLSIFWGPLLLAFVILPASVVFLSVVFILNIVLRKKLEPAFIVSICWLYFANLFACGSAIPQIFSETRFRQYSSVQIKEHTYIADGQWASGGPGTSHALVTLWECDRLGLVCSDIYHGYLETSASRFKTMQVALQIEADMLIMSIEDRVVYAQHL